MDAWVLWLVTFNIHQLSLKGALSFKYLYLICSIYLIHYNLKALSQSPATRQSGLSFLPITFMSPACLWLTVFKCLVTELHVKCTFLCQHEDGGIFLEG